MRLLWFVTLLLLAPAACGIDGADRCSEGRKWSKRYQGCLDPKPSAASTGGAAGTSGSDGIAGTATEGVAGSAGQPAAMAPELGTTCTSDAECSGTTATVCLLDPTDPASAGMCTIPNCTEAACGGTDFQCCDCTQSPMLSSSWLVPVCAPATNVATLTSVACSCK